jgi:hypothetical protein
MRDPVDEVVGSIGVVHNAGERFLDLAQVWRLPVQKIQNRTGIACALPIGCAIS